MNVAVDPQTTLTMLWQNSLSITGQTHEMLTSHDLLNKVVKLLQENDCSLYFLFSCYIFLTLFLNFLLLQYCRHWTRLHRTKNVIKTLIKWIAEKLKTFLEIRSRILHRDNLKAVSKNNWISIRPYDLHFISRGSCEGRERRRHGGTFQASTAFLCRKLNSYWRVCSRVEWGYFALSSCSKLSRCSYQRKMIWLW